MSERTEFLAKDGVEYSIAVDDHGELIEVFRGAEHLGQMRLMSAEGDPPKLDSWFHITHLELRSQGRLGIGGRGLELHREMFGSGITAGRADGIRADDGSHLTGKGPAFIARMRAEGTSVFIRLLSTTSIAR